MCTVLSDRLAMSRIQNVIVILGTGKIFTFFFNFSVSSFCYFPITNVKQVIHHKFNEKYNLIVQPNLTFISQTKLRTLLIISMS